MLKPLGDRVVISAEKKDSQTASGIVIAGGEEKPVTGVVIAAGQGRYTEQGHLIPLEVKEGDRVTFPKYAGNIIKDGDNEYLVMRESDIMVVIGE